MAKKSTLLDSRATEYFLDLEEQQGSASSQVEMHSGQMKEVVCMMLNAHKR
jgi:hypothetical protein